MKVAIYARVSTTEQAEKGYSITEQVRMLTDYCKAMRWKIYSKYVDAGESGANTNRPELQRLLSDVRSGKIERVLIYKLDRLGRNNKELLTIIEDVLKPAGVDLVSMTESLDSSTPTGRFGVSILSSVAQLELDTIKERLAIGKAARARSGKFHGGSAVPIGYRYEGGQLVVDEYEAMLVRKIFEMYADGMNPPTIAKELNAAGLIRGTVCWNPSTVHNMLGRQTYLGKIHHHDEWYEGQHEAIISEELFQRVQERRAKVRQSKAPVSSARAKSILGGLLYCSRCGGKYTHVSQKTHYKGTETIYKNYVCSNKRMHRKSYPTNFPQCENKSWKAAELDEIVLNEVRKLRLDPEYQFSAPENDQPANDPTETIKAEIERVTAQLSRLMDLYADDKIPIELLQEKVEALTEKKEKLEDQLIKKDQKTMERSDAVALAGTLAEIIDRSELNDVREILAALVSRIELDGDDVSIFWNF